MARLRILLRAARKHLDSPGGRFLLLLSCALVFLFAFHAKTAIYNNPSHIDGSTASKMWLTGTKLECDISASDAFAVWIFALFLLVVVPSMERRFENLRLAPVAVPRNQVYLERFFRPPPVR